MFRRSPTARRRIVDELFGTGTGQDRPDGSAQLTLTPARRSDAYALDAPPRPAYPRQEDPFPLSDPQNQPSAPEPDTAAPGRQTPGPGPGAPLPAPGGGVSRPPRFGAPRVTLRLVPSSGEETWRQEAESGQANTVRPRQRRRAPLRRALRQRGERRPRGGPGRCKRRPPLGPGPGGDRAGLAQQVRQPGDAQRRLGAVHVSGEESAGSYRETLDPITGETLAREVTRK